MPDSPSAPLNPTAVTDELRRTALQLGFSSVGICPAIEPPGWPNFLQWLELGFAGEMRYLPDRRDAYQHPSHVLDNARSLVMLTMDYRTVAARTPAAGRGRISRYAWGPADYHDVIHDRLHQLCDWLRDRIPSCHARGVVDTAPLLERDFASLAGLGWVGKHTLLLNRDRGSYFFLAALLTDKILSYDTPTTTDYCGSCTACLDACPTEAFAQPYVLNATRCISYLTIEHRGPIDPDLRPLMQDWIFGCDVCQDVCPWNRKNPVYSGEAAFQPVDTNNPANLLDILRLDEEAFRRRFRNTPLWRVKRRGLIRNVLIALGNQQDPRTIDSIALALDDPEPLIRGAAAWALSQMPDPNYVQAQLRQRLKTESDEIVKEELQRALG